MEIVLENKGDSIFRCTYVPVLEGPHTVYVTFAGQQIPRSPFTVHISEGRLTDSCQFFTFVLDVCGSLKSSQFKSSHFVIMNVHVTSEDSECCRNI